MEFMKLAFFTSTMLVNCTNIESLSLRGNGKWQTITAGTFRTLPNLKILEIYNSYITAIDADAFVGLSQLKQLKMHTLSRLKHIPNGAFNGLQNLQSFSSGLVVGRVHLA